MHAVLQQQILEVLLSCAHTHRSPPHKVLLQLRLEGQHSCCTG